MNEPQPTTSAITTKMAVTSNTAQTQDRFDFENGIVLGPVGPAGRKEERPGNFKIALRVVSSVINVSVAQSKSSRVE